MVKVAWGGSKLTNLPREWGGVTRGPRVVTYTTPLGPVTKQRHERGERKKGGRKGLGTKKERSEAAQKRRLCFQKREKLKGRGGGGRGTRNRKRLEKRGKRCHPKVPKEDLWGGGVKRDFRGGWTEMVRGGRCL